MRAGTTLAIRLAAITGGAGSAVFLAVPTLRITILTIVLSLLSLTIFLTARHVELVARRQEDQWPKRPSDQQGEPPRHRSEDYYLFVLGSGGHTKEMLMMMDDGFCNFAGLHRRYLISSGDTMSDNHLEDYESELKALCRDKATSPGTYDKRTVTRARRVHQPLWSTPLTALRSIIDIFPVLLSPPRDNGKNPRYPSQIYSNGPATALFVALAAYLLRVFYLVPEDSMRFVYIESWARISTLSLTGKLLFYSGIADAFFVQHQEVASKYGLPNAGEMVFNSRRPDA